MLIVRVELQIEMLSCMIIITSMSIKIKGNILIRNVNKLIFLSTTIMQINLFYSTTAFGSSELLFPLILKSSRNNK